MERKSDIHKHYNDMENKTTRVEHLILNGRKKLNLSRTFNKKILSEQRASLLLLLFSVTSTINKVKPLKMTFIKTRGLRQEKGGWLIR